MPPQRGNSGLLKKLPVSGGIKNDILMPPETGNWTADKKNYPFRVILNCRF